jgi:hypothetical protein
MATFAKRKVTHLGGIGTITTVIQTFDDSDEVNIFQTLSLENSDENSVIEITNSNPKHPLLGDPEDLSELEQLVRFLTITG